jgi:hypothetical protein
MNLVIRTAVTSEYIKGSIATRSKHISFSHIFTSSFRQESSTTRTALFKSILSRSHILNMLFNTPIVLSAILLPLASATCYGDSPSNTNKQFALDNLKAAAIQIQGGLEPGQVRGKCVTDTNLGYTWYYSIRNVGKTGVAIGRDTIISHIQTEIQGCGRNGGFSEYDNVHYK